MYTTKIYKNKSGIDGNGVFSAEFIPKGFIVFYLSSKDNFFSKNEVQSLSAEKRDRLFKYGVEDEAGNWTMLDEDANHSCDANILSLFIDGIYCDIAVKDIYAGDEITIDYGLFYSSFLWSIKCKCHSAICRKDIGPGLSVDSNTQLLWLSRISDAVSKIHHVKQKLFSVQEVSARALTLTLESKKNAKVFPYIKFSLIS
jgi:uncharacterized protein